jgi:hypothetical protein
MPTSLSTPVTSIFFVTAGFSVSKMTSVLSPVRPRTGAANAVDATAMEAAEAISAKRMIFMSFSRVEPFGSRVALGARLSTLPELKTRQPCRLDAACEKIISTCIHSSIQRV